MQSQTITTGFLAAITAGQALMKGPNYDAMPWWHAKNAAAHAFAALNGWRLVDRSFWPEDIGKRSTRCSEYPPHGVFDHVLYFRQNGRNAGIVTQPYYPPGPELTVIAAKHRLAWSMAPRAQASFHFPGVAWFAVLHQPDHEMRWLPEQEWDARTGVSVRAERQPSKHGE